MWTDGQFWRDATWRAFRTFCQSLAGLLLAVQTSDQIAAIATISIPWYGYLYASAVSAFVSLLQSIDRERVAVAAAVEPVVPAPVLPVSGNRTLPAVVVGDPAAADYQPYWRPR
jgi:hypothetical protein